MGNWLHTGSCDETSRPTSERASLAQAGSWT